MSHAPNTIEVKLTVHYHGLKATQYFSKTSPESETVFLDDMLTLKLPLPKRGNTTLISFGRMQCIWPAVQKNGLLHKQIKMRVEPFPDHRPAVQELFAELSIANIMAKFRDLDSSEITHVSFKRQFKDVEDTATEERPWKKKRTEQEPRDMNAANTVSPPKRVPNHVKNKSAFSVASEKPPSAPRAMTMADPQWRTPSKQSHSHSHSVDSPSISSQHDSAQPQRLSGSGKRPTSDATDAASEFLNSMEIPHGFLPNSNLASRWDTAVKRRTNDQPKPPPTSAPAVIQSLSTTSSIQHTTSSNASSTSTLPPRPGSTSSSSLPPRPSSNPPPLSASASDDPVRRQSRFGPAPAPPPQYSLHTLAEFAKEYTTKIERQSPELFERMPSPAPVPHHRPAAQTQPPPPAAAAASWSRPAPGVPLPSSAASTLPSIPSVATTASDSAFKPFKFSAREDRSVADGAGRVRSKMRSHWPEEGPASSNEIPTRTVMVRRATIEGSDAFREGKTKATALTSGEREKTGVMRGDVEMRDAKRRDLPPTTSSVSSGTPHDSRKRSTESGGSGYAATVKEHETALAELRGRLAKMEAELAQERRRRLAAEDAIADIRRECRAPFVVPSLLDAFVELSRLATVATTTTTVQQHHSKSLVVSLPPPPQLDGGNVASKPQPSQKHIDGNNKSNAANGSSARRTSIVDTATVASRSLPSPSVTYNHSSSQQQQWQSTIRINGGGPNTAQRSGAPIRPPTTFVRGRGGASNAQVSNSVRVKEEPVEMRMSW